MCARFSLTWNEWRQVAGALGIEDEGDAAASYRPRFNIAPRLSQYDRKDSKFCTQ